MMSTSKMLFFATLILGTLLTMSSTNWLGIWMGLELNLISFIPLMYKRKNSQASEAMMIYFLTQTMGSALMLMSILMNSWMMTSEILSENTATMVTMSSIGLKMGAAPFHFWLPMVMSKLEWKNCMILATWQKFAPLTVMSYMTDNIPMLMVMAAASTIVGAAGGINQTSLRMIMAYSSISHVGWMLACMSMENQAWMFYLLTYSVIALTAMIAFDNMSAYYLNQFSLNTTLLEKLTYTSMFMSMGGLPPFLGFLPKLLVIQFMAESKMFLIMTIMVLTTLVTLFYYLRTNTTMMLINLTSNKWNINKPASKLLLTIVLMVNLSTPLFAIFFL